MQRKIKVAYFELNEVGFYEDYSINPNKYGGGPVFARWAKEEWNKPDSKFEFKIFAPRKCWEHIDEKVENKSSFIELNEQYCELLLRKGLNIKQIIPDIDYFDIILHGHTNQAINNMDCRCIQVHWSGFGRASDGHPFIPYTLVYGPDLTPCYPNQKTFPIVIGKPVPKEFNYIQKEDYIFQCSRHDISYDSIQIAQECIKNNIKVIFAGPIQGDYPLLNHIDNINTFYLGIISEQEKIELSKKARLATFITPLGSVFNQSVVECLGHGTPIMFKKIEKSKDPTFRDWLKEIIIDGYNGVCYDGINFLDCWGKSKHINQKNCWKTAKKYSTEEMLLSFENAIKEILKENNRL